MARDGWLHENARRSYPFVVGSVGRRPVGPADVGHLPDDAVVDAGFVLGTDSGFITGTHAVSLARVRRSGPTLWFDFASDAPGLFGLTLTFTRAATDPEFLTEHLDGGEAVGGSGSADECNEPAWFGFLTTGKLAALADLVPDGGALAAAAGDGLVEPALLQNLAGSVVTSLALANFDRTRASNPEGCPILEWPDAPGTVFVRRRCVVGRVAFRPGYNAVVTQDDLNRAIAFGAAVGEGAGEVCAQVPVQPGEVPPPDSIYLEGGPACNEVLRSVNGLGGPRIDLVGGVGVTVTPDVAGHRLVVDADFTGLAGCSFDTDLDELSEIV